MFLCCRIIRVMPFPQDEDTKCKTRIYQKKRKLNTDSDDERIKLKTDSGELLESISIDSEQSKSKTTDSGGDALEPNTINSKKKKSKADSTLKTSSIDYERTTFKADSGGDVLEGVSREYWKDLAEERRVALEEALLENQKLTERVEALEAENRDLEEMLSDAKSLAEMINVRTKEFN